MEHAQSSFPPHVGWRPKRIFVRILTRSPHGLSCVPSSGLRATQPQAAEGQRCLVSFVGMQIHAACRACGVEPSFTAPSPEARTGSRIILQAPRVLSLGQENCSGHPKAAQCEKSVELQFAPLPSLLAGQPADLLAVFLCRCAILVSKKRAAALCLNTDIVQEDCHVATLGSSAENLLQGGPTSI